MLRGRDVYLLHEDAEGADRGAALPWSLVEDPASDRIVLHFPRYVSTEVARSAVSAVAARLARRGRSARITVDLLSVEGYDATAPVAAIKAAVPIALLIRDVELVVRNRMVRIAAASAAHLLNLPFTVRDQV